jgi:glycosyltransferase involved in cell wall biosynthesis
MKVLFCHNYYRFRGGEDESFEAEVDMLRSRGDEVITFTRSNAEIPDNLIGKARTIARTIHSRSARRAIASLVRLHRPDVMHCNNLFPQISTSIYAPAHASGIPIVQALRNYREFCANAFLFRDGRVCTDCLPMPATFLSVVHGCYRDSRVASAVVTGMQLAERTKKRWQPMVDMYFTPTEFARQVYVSGGYDAESIVVKQNFVHPDPGVGKGELPVFVQVGRLSHEKGLRIVMDAWREHGLELPLQIIGDGPLQVEVERLAAENRHVQYLGRADMDEVLRILGRARCLIMPSLWYETFGRAMSEAFSCGTPVIASRLGAMAELVQDGVNGFLFAPGDAAELARAVQRVSGMGQHEYMQLRANARRSFETRYTRDSNYSRLMEIYELAARRRRERTTGRSHESVGTLPAVAVPAEDHP